MFFFESIPWYNWIMWLIVLVTLMGLNEIIVNVHQAPIDRKSVTLST